MKETTRPLSFKYETFEWKITYTDQESRVYGITFMDNKEILIHLRVAITEQMIKDVLFHELLHVVSENIFKALDDMGELKFDIKEEHYIRFTTPRLNSLLRDNPEIREYLWGEE